MRASDGIRWLSRAAGGLLFAVVLLEVSLQLGALGIHWLSQRPARVAAPSVAGGEYRVLCLGESTTEGFGEKSYPEILAAELARRDYGVTFRVINSGRRAADSSLLLDALPRLLDLYRPHMVVAMLGVNDQFFFGTSERLGLPAGVQLWLLESRVYKLATLLGENLRAWLSAGAPAHVEVPDPAHFEAYAAEFERVWELWRSGELPDPEAPFAALIDRARAGAGGEGDRLPDAYLRSYYNSHLALARSYLAAGLGDRAVALYERAIERHPETEFFTRALAGVHRELGRDALADRYRDRARELAGRRILSVTRDNYRAIQRLLAGRGVDFVAMQYPLRSVETLRLLLGDADRTTYVDNEEIFRQGIEREGYEALFVDRVAGDFGHCTERGNRLIAENLLATVFEPRFGPTGSEP